MPNQTKNDLDSEVEQIVTTVPAGMFNNLEQAVAQQVMIEFLHWLRAVRKDMPDNMVIAGKECVIGFPKNRIDVDYHTGNCRRPKRLRWQVSVELRDYVEGVK